MKKAILFEHVTRGILYTHGWLVVTYPKDEKDSTILIVNDDYYSLIDLN